MVVAWFVVTHCGKQELNDKRNDTIRTPGEPTYV